MESVVEAVIISGPRRGEIIQLPDEDIAEISRIFSCSMKLWMDSSGRSTESLQRCVLQVRRYTCDSACGR